jgi:hypothetical protein
MIWKKSQNRFIASIALFVVSTNCHAEFTSAGFGDPEAEKSIYKFVAFPDVKGDVTVTMGCAVIATNGGKFKDNLCYLQNDFDQPFAGSMFNASKKARLVPASIDGREKSVYLQYRVKFVKEGERMGVQLVANPGVDENVAEYGDDHVAAQRVVGKEKWQKVCPKSAGYMVHVRAHVNELGKASSISLSHGGGIVPPIACQDAIIRNIAESEYIPAFADGVAVPSTYAEPFSN